MTITVLITNLYWRSAGQSDITDKTNETSTFVGRNVEILTKYKFTHNKNLINEKR